MPAPPRKIALLIGNDRYQHFPELEVPAADVAGLAAVLRDPAIGGFNEVQTLANPGLIAALQAIGELFAKRAPDDLVLLYFSGHGEKDGWRPALYLALPDSRGDLLRTTAIPDRVIADEMDACRAGGQVLILDCCFAGAFGAKGEEAIDLGRFDGQAGGGEGPAGEAPVAPGRGRVTLMSSRGTQRSWEGNRVIDGVTRSLFTHFLIEGLATGKAAEGKAQIDVQDLFDYTRGEVIRATRAAGVPPMDPQIRVHQGEGRVILARNPHPPVPRAEEVLPAELLADLVSGNHRTRMGAVHELAQMLRHHGIGAAVRTLLEERLAPGGERDFEVRALIERVLAEGARGVPHPGPDGDPHRPRKRASAPSIGEDSAGAASAPPSTAGAPVVNRNRRYLLGVMAAGGVRVLAATGLSIFLPASRVPPKPPSPVTPSAPGLTESGMSEERVETLQREWASYLGREVAFRDPLKSGGEGPEMMIIPPGRFLMGSPEDEPERFKDEGPQHAVTIARPFALGRYAVTRGEFAAFAEAAGYQTAGEKDGGIYAWVGKAWKQDPARTWRSPGFAQDDRHPVVGVSWKDAQEYCRWLAEQTGKDYRLPTEAEWEYACRAGTTTPFWWGSTISTDQANYDGNYPYNQGAKGEFRQGTVPVDQFQPNPWGLYQVHGNVWEWVQDAWHDSYEGAPNDGSAWDDPAGVGRVVRGGSWFALAWHCRAAQRYRREPGDRGGNQGFRLARGPV